MATSKGRDHAWDEAVRLADSFDNVDQAEDTSQAARELVERFALAYGFRAVRDVIGARREAVGLQFQRSDGTASWVEAWPVLLVYPDQGPPVPEEVEIPRHPRSSALTVPARILPVRNLVAVELLDGWEGDAWRRLAWWVEKLAAHGGYGPITYAKGFRSTFANWDGFVDEFTALVRAPWDDHHPQQAPEP